MNVYYQFKQSELVVNLLTGKLGRLSTAFINSVSSYSDEKPWHPVTLLLQSGKTVIFIRQFPLFVDHHAWVVMTSPILELLVIPDDLWSAVYSTYMLSQLEN